MSEKRGRLIVISAPSGAGKDTVIDRLRKIHPGIILSVSATTRAKRKGEVDGVSYYFVSREEFSAMIERNEFLEHAEYVGELYGTPIKPIEKHIGEGRDVILEIEVQGARQVIELEPNAMTIFIVPPDMVELERRLRGRGTDTEETLKARLERAQTEMEEKDCYAHVVVNDEVERAAREILSIIYDGDR